MNVNISVIKADVATVPAEVLLLKHAHGFHGADEVVALRLLRQQVCHENELNVAEGDFKLIPTKGALESRQILLLGTARLRGFSYPQMRQFARRAIEILAEHAPNIASLALTVHGAGYGLDIEEALRSLLLGLQQGLATHPLRALRQIQFIEHNARRFDIVQKALADVELVVPQNHSAPSTSLLNATPVEKKKSVFVAMPFTEDFEDIYQFGIYATMRRLGYVCEKVDESVFTGNIVERITDGIRNAEFVIADLSLERPNVYLEVGFAWGLKKPVILVAREGQRLHFDLSHHKCLFYRTIGKLSESLEKTIRDIFPERDLGA